MASAYFSGLFSGLFIARNPCGPSILFFIGLFIGLLSNIGKGPSVIRMTWVQSLSRVFTAIFASPSLRDSHATIQDRKLCFNQSYDAHTTNELNFLPQEQPQPELQVVAAHRNCSLCCAPESLTNPSANMRNSILLTLNLSRDMLCVSLSGFFAEI